MRGGTSEGAACPHQQVTVTLAPFCPPLCQPGGPGSPTAPHKTEHDTGHGGDLCLAGEAAHAGTDRGVSDGEGYSGGGKV